MSDKVLSLTGLLTFLHTFAIANSQASFQCQPVVGYRAYAGVDHPLDDLPDPNCAKAPVSSLAAACNSLPWCVSFNTDGCLKYKQNTTQTGKGDGFCFYVKDVNMDCPAVPGFDVQQGRGYNDMTAEGDISIGRECFRNISIAQLAHECQTDVNCNAFDSWGCLKNYTFLNDNGLGPSYCFYTKSTPATTEMSYCIQGWNAAGNDIAHVANIDDIASCQQQCAQSASCTYVVWDSNIRVCYLKKDLMYGPDGITGQYAPDILCTKGQPSCPEIQGFRSYFGGVAYSEDWSYDCSQPKMASIQQNQQFAAECLANPGCAGFDQTSCLALNPAIDSGLGINCFYERVNFTSPTCPDIAGYTVHMGVDHDGDDIDGSCFRNQTIEQTAQDCNITPDCAGFDSLNCLVFDDNVTVNYNGRSNGFCYYSKETSNNLPASTRSFQTDIPGSTNECEAVPGYTAYPRADHTGDNLPGPNCINASVQSLAAKCNDIPWCVSFNTDGCLKYKETTTEINMMDGFCFYTKDVSMACPHVLGFLAQQGRGYNDMTPEGDISIGRGCFRNISIAQLAQECQTDASCNAFDSWGCIKKYTFLNDNGLGPSYCFYTKEVDSTAGAMPYCIQGWDAAGTDVAKYSNINDIATCQALCDQNPFCTFIVFRQPGSPTTCFLKQDMLSGQNGTTEQVQGIEMTVCTKGAPTCQAFPGFRSYFASKYVGTSYCLAPGHALPIAAIQCLNTPECAGFDDTACITVKSTINTRLTPTCFWERAYFEPDGCTALPGYTALPPGLDHIGDDLPGTCGRNQSFLDTAKDCNASESCTAIDTYGCLKVGGNVIVNDNSLSEGFCYYLKNTALYVPLPVNTTVQAPNAKHKGISAGALAGIAVGGAVVGLLAVMLAIRFCGCRHQHPAKLQPPYVLDGHDVYVQMMQKFVDIPGLTKGEVFTRVTAYQYLWADTGDSNNFINVTSDNENEVAINGSAGPAIQLTSQEVKDEIQLLRDGLLGRGATALVFKGLWPSRFGESAVLAVKVLQDGYTADMYTLDSFCYEANVLASLNPPHPNVIRLYGYCLEPPTVCLILEVLPGSLKNRLYPKMQPVENTSRVQDVQKQGSKNTVAVSLLLQLTDTNTTQQGISMSRQAATQSMLPRSDTSTTLQYSLNNNTESAEALPGDNTPQIMMHVANDPSATSKMTMLDVLNISIDIVTGLKYLHDMPLTEDAAMIDSEKMPGLRESLLASPRSADLSNKKGHKIVHRDLKPANILLDTAGRAKISDFGLARRQLQETMETRNLAAGTLPYMAPELLVAKEIHSARFHATNRVDIYSMGMIMWEMVAGRMPWAHMHEHAVVNEVLSGRRPELPVDQQDDQPAPSLSEMPARPNALPEFNSIIRACWNQREHQRPSAAALYDMLISLRDKYS